MSPKCLRDFTEHLSLTLLTECSTSLFSKLGSSKAAKSGFKLLSYHAARQCTVSLSTVKCQFYVVSL